MDGEQRYTGQIYEERGRGFLALRGEYTYIGAAASPAWSDPSAMAMS